MFQSSGLVAQSTLETVHTSKGWEASLTAGGPSVARGPPERSAAPEVTGKKAAAPPPSAGHVPEYLLKPLGTVVSNYFPD